MTDARSIRKFLGRIFLALTGAAMLLIWIVPVFWMILSALKTNPEYLMDPLGLPGQLRFVNFVKAWNRADLGAHGLISLFITCVTVLLTILLASGAGFALSMSKSTLSRIIYGIFVVGMIFPVQGFLVGLFIEIKIMNLLDTLWAVILPTTAVGLPLGVLLMKNAFDQIPYEMCEAAEMEGSPSTWIFACVYLPMARAMTATVATFTAIAAWNEFLFPYLLIQKASLKPLTTSLYVFTTRYASDHTQLLSALTIITIPMFFTYALFQKQVESSITAGALK